MPEKDRFDATQLTDINTLTGSLAQRVYQSLREAILSLVLPPRAVIRKAEICEQLGVSRSPVSEAIAWLAAEGLVDVVPQSVTRVSCFSMTEIREGAFLREALELAAVSRVATIRSEKQLAQLKRTLRLQTLLVEDQDYAGFYQADEEFHRLIMQFTGYSKLLTVATTAWLQVDRARRLLLPTPGRTIDSIEEHRAIVEAIESRNANAARDAMKVHLSELVNRIEPLKIKQPTLFKSE